MSWPCHVVLAVETKLVLPLSTMPGAGVVAFTCTGFVQGAFKPQQQGVATEPLHNFCGARGQVLISGPRFSLCVLLLTGCEEVPGPWGTFINTLASVWGQVETENPKSLTRMCVQFLYLIAEPNHNPLKKQRFGGESYLP